MIKPHGDSLIDRFIPAEELESATTTHTIVLTERLVYDALMIAMGGFSPLTGFMAEADYSSVVEDMRLVSGHLFAIPIVLPVDADTYAGIGDRGRVALEDGTGQKIGILHLSGKFERDLSKEAAHVYGTDDRAHPGVNKILEEGPYAVAGDIGLVRERISIEFPDDFRTPAETRAYFEKKGFKTLVAFQTRNPIHRAHEYLTKVALEMVDGLMIHPIVGEVKADDIPAITRMKCYKTLIEKYYNPERVLLNILPMAMRYAGPREAVHHGIIRQN